MWCESDSPPPISCISRRACWTAQGDVHREPQPRRLQRDQTVPRRGQAGRQGHRPLDHLRRGDRRGAGCSTAAPVRCPTAMCCPTTAASSGHSSISSDVASAAHRGRCGQRHGRSHHAPRFSGRSRAPPCCPLFFELDGTFPNHEANPLNPANLDRPAGPRAGHRCRHRSGVRRRRRPLLRRRRTRPSRCRRRR